MRITFLVTGVRAPAQPPQAVPPAAPRALHRSAPAPAVTKSTTGTYWLWKKNASGFEAYKNDVLIAYQKALTSTCNMPHADQKLFVQQVTQEAGSLSPDAVGDGGFSFGIGQWYKKPYKASTWLSRNPEQKTLEWQVRELAQNACSYWKRYPGDIRRAIVHHNCPTCAIKNRKPTPCGGVDSYRLVGTSTHKRMSCYFANEVNGSATKNRITASSDISSNPLPTSPL